MKELTTEEKARAYDEALKQIKECTPDENGFITIYPQEIFPELAESEDEKVRKELKHYLEVRGCQTNKDEEYVNCNHFLSWLEKQGMQIDIANKEYWRGYREGKKEILDKYAEAEKQSEKKHKFNIGDIISNGQAVFRVDNITKNCIGQDCYFLVNVEDEKKGIRYLLLTDSEGNHSHLGEITWLCEQVDAKFEKQDEHKVEPKFEVDDWVVQNDLGIYKIVEVCESWYEVISYNDGIQYSIGFDKENDCHLWTIQDAKDGDVLINWNNTAFIFNGIEDETVKFHIAYNEKWDAIKTPSTNLSHLGLPEPQFEFHPATKEQRDLLFQKMNKAGYTFDFEKKELKKIEQKPTEWSEYDKDMLDAIETCYKLNRPLQPEHFNWLKSLKDRVQPQNHWKPSKEQLNNILDVLSFDNCTPKRQELLISLYEQLKKLK